MWLHRGSYPQQPGLPDARVGVVWASRQERYVKVVGEDHGARKVCFLFVVENANASPEGGHRDRENVVEGDHTVVVEAVGWSNPHLAGEAFDGGGDRCHRYLGHRTSGGIAG